MITYMLWHGGANYGVGDYATDTEVFPSLRAALDAFASYADHDPYRPCVRKDEPDDGGPSAWLFFSDPRECTDCDPYPDRVACFGPRGGIHCY